MVRREGERLYLKEHRLADVLALIQVLAFDRHAHRSEEGLKAEIQKPPRSATTWGAVAEEHPEFFRVVLSEEHGVSLLARHVTRRGADGKHPTLSGEHVDSLLKAAIEMHDRQVKRAERAYTMIPVWTTALGGIFTLLGVWLGQGRSP